MEIDIIITSDSVCESINDYVCAGELSAFEVNTPGITILHLPVIYVHVLRLPFIFPVPALISRLPIICNPFPLPVSCSKLSWVLDALNNGHSEMQSAVPALFQTLIRIYFLTIIHSYSMISGYIFPSRKGNVKGITEVSDCSIAVGNAK